ncbi:MAG TPA: MEDS domain-containing protein, partial [Bryobacteraceae bacterium]|nr:MEDS domain-containing protein [Bryobacteraceae bacterium]
MNPAARKSGISQVAELGWGAHFCHFYETKSDLLDILLPYFSQGLAHNELCVWITFAPLEENDAKKELIRALPDAELHLRRGDIEIAPCSDWYLSTGEFNLPAVIDKWKQKLAYARERGYEGLRVNGNEAWLTRRNWQDFAGYEEQLNQMIAGQPIIVLCTYPLSSTSADQLFDVARSHQFVIARRHGMWEVLETAASREAKEDLLRMTRELEKRVAERTSALDSANEQLRALSARLQSAREEEGARIGRELHDEVGSSLASLKWDLERLSLAVGGESARREIEGMAKLVDATITAIRRIASELRPSILESLGFAEAVECLATGFQQRTGVACHVNIPEDIPLGQDEATSLFRIAQEALTN